MVIVIPSMSLITGRFNLLAFYIINIYILMI